MMQLATIGYEGATVSDFLETLKSAGIETIVDVRELPLSRRKGFSKTALTAALQTVGIGYHHLRALGDPKAGREAARAGRFVEFRKIFSKHIKTAAAQAALREVLEIIESGEVCLLCYEREPNQCHRTMVADALAEMSDIRVIHLGVRAGISKHVRPNFRHGKLGGLGQGLTAAE